MPKNKVFEAEAKSLYDLYQIKGGVAGFRIPEYQRQYDWDKKNIQRLLEDILSGLKWRKSSVDSLTFLGTIIVLDEDTDEKTFDGHSLSVVDGQQRLTTISLLASLLHEQLSQQTLPPDIEEQLVVDWVEQEIRSIKNRLFNFIRGSLPKEDGGHFPFPRIVREEADYRGNNPQDCEYRSLIGDYLSEYARFISDQRELPFEYNIKVDSTYKKSFLNNLNFLNEQIKLVSTDVDEENNEYSDHLLQSEEFNKRGIRDIFLKAPSDETSENKIFEYCKNEGENFIGQLRLIAFANYFMDCVIITAVEARKEKYAFDIFDALNTTGEPLTAVQTFKPLVVKFEKESGAGSYQGSPSEQYMKDIENYISSNFTSNNQRQKAAKELVVPFALYITGEKVSKKLDEQRRYLRTNFNKVKENQKLAREFVLKLKEVTNYRWSFWIDENIQTQLQGFPERDLTLLCLKFLKDLKNSLTIPILCRYYVEAKNRNDKQLFVDAVKALTAFVVFRRGATGGTAGIDGDLRKIMSRGCRKKDGPSTPLNYGIHNNSPNPIVKITKFRSYLREWLSKTRIEVEDKDTWIQKVTTTQLATSAKPLCRFLILAATHNAIPDNEDKWKLVKARPGGEETMTYNRWIAKETSTVEHIAPENPKSGWDDSIYTEPYIKQSLGNLFLLPEEENKAAANKSWNKKKKLYRAFAAKTEDKVEEVIQEAEKDGIKFSNKNIEALKEGEQLPLANTVIVWDNWDREVIKKRSENLAELAWEEISPWLFED